MSPQRHIAQIFLCSSTEQIAQGVLAIRLMYPVKNLLFRFTM